MPAMYLRFDEGADPALHVASESVDLTLLFGAQFDAITTALGLRNLFDFTGVTENEWAALLEAMPPSMHEPWTPGKSPWFACAEGIAWGRGLAGYVRDHPAEFDEWKGQQADILAVLDTLVAVLEQASPGGARFQFFTAP